MQQLEADITIIGAGLTGLTLSYYLEKAGKKVLLVEKDNRVGGVMRTIEENGFVFETGPNSGALGSTEIVELFEDLKDGCELEIANPASKKRLILKQGAWQPLPSGLKQAIETKLFTAKDKFRILLEPFRKRGVNPDESVAELVIRRLGRSYLDYAVDPFISGIYGGDPEKLITRFALAKLYNLEQKYGSFIRGSVKKKFEPKTELEKKVTRDVFSAKGGLQNLIDAIKSGINQENIYLENNNVEVNPQEGNFLVKFQQGNNGQVEINSKKVVTTTGGHALPGILPFVEKEYLDSISKLNYASMTQVIVGYKNWDGIPLDAFGGLIPGKENNPVLGILFTSSLFSGRAQNGGATLSFFIGGVKKPEMLAKTDEEIKNIVENELKSLMKTEKNPDLFRIFRYKHAIPQYDILMEQNLKAIEKIQNMYPGLVLAGNIRDGIGMADRVKQAKRIAGDL